VLYTDLEKLLAGEDQQQGTGDQDRRVYDGIQ